MFIDILWVGGLIFPGVLTALRFRLVWVQTFVFGYHGYYIRVFLLLIAANGLWRF